MRRQSWMERQSLFKHCETLTVNKQFIVWLKITHKRKIGEKRKIFSTSWLFRLLLVLQSPSHDCCLQTENISFPPSSWHDAVLMTSYWACHKINVQRRYDDTKIYERISRLDMWKESVAFDKLIIKVFNWKKEISFLYFLFLF